MVSLIVVVARGCFLSEVFERNSSFSVKFKAQELLFLTEKRYFQ